MKNESTSGLLRGRLGLAVVVLVCVGCLTPFAGKAFHIDDPLFLWAARHIQSHPSDPYGFSVTWYVSSMSMAEVTKNPPIACYYLAAAATLFGWNETALHLAFLLPALGAAFCTYLLAEQMCARPLLAALATVLTPVFLVSSSNLMCDTMMLWVWLAALLCWRRGLERPIWLIVAAVLISVCALTKYFGVSLIPLLLAYTFVSQRRRGFAFGVMVIPLGVLAGYEIMAHRLYDRSLLLDAIGFSVGMRKELEPWWVTPWIGLSFTGGCMGVVLFYLPFLWSKRVLLAGAALAALLALPLVRIENRPWSWSMFIQAAIWVLSGLAVVALAVTDLRQRRDADAWLLFLWVAGTLVFAVRLNWVINGRSILPLAPAVGILLVRRLETQHWRGGKAKWLQALPLIPAAALAVAVTAADCRQADSDRSAARAIAAECSGRTLWFEGHWGFQYYMQLAGGEPADYYEHPFRAGDFFAVPETNYGLWFDLESSAFCEVLRIERPPLLGLTTMNPRQGAGFYSHGFGPLPFMFGSSEAMRYRLVQLTAPAD